MSARVPRNFRLLEELEKGEKGLSTEASVSCSYGLKDGDDNTMSEWACTILGPGHSVHENRIYSLEIHCGESYPDLPPDVKFLTKINLPCVDQTNGKVMANRFPTLGSWSRTFTMEKILVELRRSMAEPANRKLPQPAENAQF